MQTFINSANARVMQQKGLLERRKRKAEQRKRDVLFEALQQKYVNEQSLHVIQPEESFRIQRLVRVRKQLELCDNGIIEEMEKRYPDTEKLKDWTQAQMRLHDQEMQLAGRPLPGSYRPKDEKHLGRRHSSSDPAPEFEPTIELAGPQDSIPTDSLTIWKDNPQPLV